MLHKLQCCKIWSAAGNGINARDTNSGIRLSTRRASVSDWLLRGSRWSCFPVISLTHLLFFPPRGVVAFLSKCPISDLIHQHYLITKTPSNNLQTCFWFSTRRCHLSKPTLQLRKLDYWIRPGRVTGGSRDQPEVRLNKYEMPTHVITSPHSIRFDSMNKACKAAVNLNVGIYWAAKFHF